MASSTAKKSHGQDVRKAKVINELDAGDSPSDVTEKYKISKSMVSNWLKNKINIMKAAANEHKIHLKIRPARKYLDEYKELLTVFKNARTWGHQVDFDWLWCKARKIYREQINIPDAIIRKHMIVNFINSHDLKLRARQRNRRRSKESFRKELQKWHQTTRERLVRKGLNDRYDTKWGRFLP